MVIFVILMMGKMILVMVMTEILLMMKLLMITHILVNQRWRMR